MIFWNFPQQNMISTKKFSQQLCLLFLFCSLVNGLFRQTLTEKSDQVSEGKLSRLVRDVRLSLLHQEKSFLGERVKRQMAQMQKMKPLTIAPTDWTAINSLNRKPSFVSSTSQSDAQHIDTKNPGLSLAHSLAFSLDIQGPLGDSSSKFQGNQNFGQGATSSADSAAGTGEKGGPALAAADTSAQISGVDAESLGSSATLNKAKVIMSGNAGGVSNAKGSVNLADNKNAQPLIQTSQAQPQQDTIPVIVPSSKKTIPRTMTTKITTTSTTTSSTTTSSTTTSTTAATVEPAIVQDDSTFQPEPDTRRNNPNRSQQRERQRNRHHNNQGNFGEESAFFPTNVGFDNIGNSNFGGFNNAGNAFGSPFNAGNEPQRSREMPSNTYQGKLSFGSFGDSASRASPTGQFPSLFGSSSFGSNTFPAFSSFQG